MTRIFAVVLAFSLAAPLAVQAAPDPISAALQAKAPAVLELAQKKGYKNLGVLKFLVQTDDGRTSDDVGDLNLTLANKTEVALILANTDDTFGIIDKASEFVAREKLLSANHTTPEGRKVFFTRKYELAWSREKVDPSGFLTGTVTFSKDLKKMTITLQLFDRSGTIEDLPDAITAPTDPEMLAQAGFSYALPRSRQKALIAGDPVPTREVRNEEAISATLRATDPPTPDKKPEPFAPLANSPVKLTVLYNNKPVELNGNAVPEPGMDDAVSFHLENPGPGVYAVVLLVNGENTLYAERQAPLTCRKWVLPPESDVVVRGFQVGPNKVAPFTVMLPEAAEADMIRYGDHAGTYRLVVYHGTMSSTPPQNVAKLNRDDSTALSIARTRGATRPDGVKPLSLRALQADLRGRAESGEGSRGYVGKGKQTETFETEAVYFVPSSDTPVADISLRYYNAKK